MPNLQIRKRRDKSKPGPPWPLAGVYLQSPNLPLDHVMSDQYVAEAIEEGWAFIVDGVLELRFANETVGYQIVEAPGRYNDPSAPGGYRIEHQYALHLLYPRPS